MRFYFKTMLKSLKMNTFTTGEKTIIFLEWLVNAIIKIFFLPLCLIGMVCSLLQELFDFLNELFWGLTNWASEKEISFVSIEKKKEFVEKFKRGLK